MKIRNVRQIFAVFVLLVCNDAVAQNTYDIEGESIIVSGYLDRAMATAIAEKLDRNFAIREIAFRKVLGGNIGGAYTLFETIRRKKLRTRVDGQCHSACAIAFMAGTERTNKPIDSLSMHQSILSFHASRKATNDDKVETDPALNDKILAKIDGATGGKLSEQVRALIGASFTPTSGVIFIRRQVRGVVSQKTVHCNGTEGGNLSKCVEIENSDPLQMGILTR